MMTGGSPMRTRALLPVGAPPPPPSAARIAVTTACNDVWMWKHGAGTRRRAEASILLAGILVAECAIDDETRAQLEHFINEARRALCEETKP